MKKKLLALSVAALVGGFASGAYAAVIPGTGPNPVVVPTPAAHPASMGANTATTLVFNPNGTGHILLVPYYTAQNGNATLLNIVNTDTINGKAVKVRFRGAQNSDDVFDFQLYLSPGDVWAASITQGADGRAQLSTPDNSCTLPANVNQSFVTARLPGDATAQANGTREGYVEIFNMADIPPYLADAATETLYETIKHKADGTVTCGAALTSLGADIVTEAAAGTAGFDTPTSGLMANYTIIQVQEASSWSGTAAAIVAGTGASTGVPPAIVTGPVAGRANFVWFPQTATAAATTAVIANVTADPILRIGAVTPAYFDLPDLSTPYVTPALLGAPELQASQLTASIAVTSVINEYLTDPGITAATDWVFSLPTRRYAVAIDYRAATPDNAKLVFNQGVFVPGGAYLTDSYFAAAPGAGVQVAGGPNTAGSGANITRTDLTACLQLGSGAIAVNDRSEKAAQTTDFVISPGTPTVLQFCGEDNVLSFNSSTSAASVLGASVARGNIDIGTFVDGWATINTAGNPSLVHAGGRAGLPVLGQAYVKATNPAVAAGVSANFGVSWDHRYTRP